MKGLIISFLFAFTTLSASAQIPKSGRYVYTVSFAEFGGQSLGATCIVIIKGKSITVINDGSLSGEKGEIIEKGKIEKHIKTGKWIIARNSRDKYAKEIGDCSEGPAVIDFKNKKVRMC